jgi:hypothetical protein
MVLGLTRVCLDLESSVCTGMAECLGLSKGHCATPSSTSARYQVIEGDLAALTFDAGSVDLGTARCIGGMIDKDRVTDLAPAPESGTGSYFLSRDILTELDFGAASSGERRDTVVVDGSCP